MKTCELIRPLLSRFAEGEAEPEEALRVARHLAGCTACKIVLARERRLHEALDGLGDSVSVDDEFSALVMAALPAGPPPEASRSRRRGLRLAGFAGAVTLGTALAFRLLALTPGLETVRFASPLDLDGGSRLLDGLAPIAGAAAAALAKIAVGLRAPWRAASGGIGSGVAPLLAMSAFLAAGSLLAAGTWAASRRLRRGRGPASRGDETPSERAY